MTSPAIKKHKKLYKKAKKITDTIHRHHRAAYDAAIDEHLTGKDGLVDMEKLDDSKIQDKFIDKMTDVYLSKAKQTLGIKGKGDIEDEIILNSYAGITKNELKGVIKSQGSNYNFDKHHNTMKNIVDEKIKPTIEGAARSHFKSKDIDDILKYTKADKFVDSKKIEKHEAILLLEDYHQAKQLIPKAYKRTKFYKK